MEFKITHMESTMWQHLQQTPEISTAIQELVHRLHDQHLLDQSIEVSKSQSQIPQYIAWINHSSASGYAGLAILDAYLDACFPNQGYDLAGHYALQCATKFELDNVPYGLSSGLSGLAFAAKLLSCQGARYEKLLNTLDQRICEVVYQQVGQMELQHHGFGSSQYDVISGLSGVGAYLLCRSDISTCREALHKIGSMLVALSGNEHGVPHWYVPHEMIMQDTLPPHYPTGLMDSGMAHGITGPLATLALMYKHNEIVPDHSHAIEEMANWLIANRCDDEWGINWGTMYPIEGVGEPPRPARTAWCYGAPGIARALWLAGSALNNDAYKKTAIDAMKAVCCKSLQDVPPNLCHGIAGILMITLRFWNDTQMPIFETAAQDILTQLIRLYDSNFLLGYRDHEYDRRLDRADLLNGSIGITLALLASNYNVEPTWDRLFLLA